VLQLLEYFDLLPSGRFVKPSKMAAKDRGDFGPQRIFHMTKT